MDQRNIKMRLRMLGLRNGNLSYQAWLTWTLDQSKFFKTNVLYDIPLEGGV